MKSRNETEQRPHPARGRLLSLFGVVLAVALGAAIALRPGSDRITTLASVTSPGAAAGCNVLLVTIDTIRRDRLGCYGHEQAHTPVIDALARAGALVDDAVASAPLTLPSHTTILTGLYPPRHGVHDNGRYALDAAHLTLAESLQRAGYSTAAFVGAFVLDERFGLAQGFDVYDFRFTSQGYRPKMPDFNERSADAVTDAALAWLKDSPRR